MDSGYRGSVDGTAWDVPTVHWDGMDSGDRGSVDGTAWDVPTLPNASYCIVEQGGHGTIDGTIWDIPLPSSPVQWDGNGQVKEFK